MADVRSMYRKWIEVLWNGDFTAADELVADNFVGHWPGGQDVKGKAELLDVIRMGRAPFPDMKFEIEQGPLADGNYVAGRWRGIGNYEGGLPGATADNGTRVVFKGSDILRVEGSKFAEYWVSSDESDLMAQLTH